MSNKQAEGETERKRETNGQNYGGHSQGNTENCQLNSAEREKEETERGTYRQSFEWRVYKIQGNKQTCTGKKKNCPLYSAERETNRQPDDTFKDGLGC